MKATIWGVKNLKKTEKMNHDTGVKEVEKRCTGTIEFSVLAKEAGVYEDQAVYILTEEEYLVISGSKTPLLSDFAVKQDAILDLTLLSSKLIKELAEREG